MPVSQELQNLIQQQYPWMNAEMLNAYVTTWGEYDDAGLALAQVRQTESYKTVFAGNYDSETGGVRMSESDYFANKASFDAVIVGSGLNPDYFEDEWLMALEGDVSPREMLARMEATQERVILASDEIRKYYSDNFGIDMTDAAILASAISPRIGEGILNKQIAMSEIGGSAAQRGFDIGKDFAEMLQENIDPSQAGNFFGEARTLIPMMNILQARHSDPDDSFDLNDVSSALLFDDPETRRRIRIARAQEASTFTGGGQLDYAKDRTGGVTGLAVQ
jgi:hypothetical protein